MTIRKQISFGRKGAGARVRFDAEDTRANSANRGYDHRWRLLARDFRIRFPLCANFETCRSGTEHIDHKIPLAFGGERLDEANLNPLCSSCHSYKTIIDKSILKLAVKGGLVKPSCGWFEPVDKNAAISFYIAEYIKKYPRGVLKFT